MTQLTLTQTTTTTQHDPPQPPLPPPTSTQLLYSTTPTHHEESSDPDADDVDSDTPSHEIPSDLIEDDMEPWEDFVRRCTYDVEHKMNKLASRIGSAANDEENGKLPNDLQMTNTTNGP